MASFNDAGSSEMQGGVLRTDTGLMADHTAQLAAIPFYNV
jgi:hypothetical protein